MIQNQHQYQVTQNKLRDLENALVELEKTRDDLHSRRYLVRKNSLIRNIDALNQEIIDYESLKQPETSIKITAIADLPLALIKARIALGMTQKELAEKIGVKEQQVQRHEANQYSTAGFNRIAEVATALNIEIQETSLIWNDHPSDTLSSEDLLPN